MDKRVYVKPEIYSIGLVEELLFSSSIDKFDGEATSPEEAEGKPFAGFELEDDGVEL